MQNRNLEQEIRIAQSKIEQKKQEFHDIQLMQLDKVREMQKQRWRDDSQFQNRQEMIQKYLQLRSNAKLRSGDHIQPTKYLFSGLTIEECRHFHQRIKEKKILMKQQIKITDNTDLNTKYWKMYGQFIKQSSINQQNTNQMAKHIAQIKGMISVLDNPPDFNTLKVCTKQPLEQATILGLEKRYEKLQKRVKDKQVYDLDISQIMDKAKKYFELQYGPPESQDLFTSSIRDA